MNILRLRLWWGVYTCIQIIVKFVGEVDCKERVCHYRVDDAIVCHRYLLSEH